MKKLCQKRWHLSFEIDDPLFFNCGRVCLGDADLFWPLWDFSTHNWKNHRGFSKNHVATWYHLEGRAALYCARFLCAPQSEDRRHLKQLCECNPRVIKDILKFDTFKKIYILFSRSISIYLKIIIVFSVSVPTWEKILTVFERQLAEILKFQI